MQRIMVRNVADDGKFGTPLHILALLTIWARVFQDYPRLPPDPKTL